MPTFVTPLPNEPTEGQGGHIQDSSRVRAALSELRELLDTYPVADLDATGTADATTFLRGDGTWASGPAGPEGASAYDIWLAQGNSGTEQDFLDSLRPEPLILAAGEPVPAGTPTGTLIFREA